MKKLGILIVVLVIGVLVFADMNNTIKQMPNAYWWSPGYAHYSDPARMWAREVEEYIENERTFVAFDSNPVCMDLDQENSDPNGTAGAENSMAINQTNFEYHIVGTQTLKHPVIDPNGLDVAMDLTANDGVEITQGITAAAKHAYVVGTDECYLKVKLEISDVSGTDACLVGFRKAEAYQADPNSYDEMVALDVISGNIFIDEILNNAATAQTDTTDNWADGATKTLEVIVGSAGAVTFKIDGSAPTTTSAFTFDTSEVIVPFFFLRHDTDVAENTSLAEWECGKLN
jgi:hypothetical protein